LIFFAWKKLCCLELQNYDCFLGKMQQIFSVFQLGQIVFPALGCDLVAGKVSAKLNAKRLIEMPNNLLTTKSLHHSFQTIS